jgi:Skp family chaperone for outer membrane proteins
MTDSNAASPTNANLDTDANQMPANAYPAAPPAMMHLPFPLPPGAILCWCTKPSLEVPCMHEHPYQLDNDYPYDYRFGLDHGSHYSVASVQGLPHDESQHQYGIGGYDTYASDLTLQTQSPANANLSANFSDALSPVNLENLPASDEDWGVVEGAEEEQEEMVEDDVNGMHFELSDEMKKILEHAALRESEKNKKKEEQKKAWEHHQVYSQEEAKRAAEERAQKLYGDNKDTILAMEASLDAHFNRVYESFKEQGKPQPPLWPVEPINLKAHQLGV